MASVAFDLFLPEVMPECPGVPEPVAINAVRNACFDFCKGSLFWNETQSDQDYLSGVAEYELVAPTGAQVVSVLSVGLDDALAVFPWPLEDVAASRPTWRTLTGTVAGFVQPAQNVVRFVPIPDSDGTFTPTVAYAPSRDATVVDARLYNLYLETIKCGALYKLKVMPGQPWSDPSSAQYYKREFDRGVGQAVVERNRGNSRAVIRVAPRTFA